MTTCLERRSPMAARLSGCWETPWTLPASLGTGVFVLVLLLLAAPIALAVDPPAGRIVDQVKCAADESESYALYLPSNYSAERSWPAIFAFDPAARGRLPVERYQAAAEKYGYIVAGSNNSRNGSWEVSAQAARAMTNDVGVRFRIDPRRVYTAGMSGGARVALGLALSGQGIAGVIASSAGFPDSKPRKSVAFAVFGTAGTEDFNLMEMRRLDRALTSPHRLAVFEGGHTWLSSELAIQAVEWMEIQAVKAGSAAGGERIERIYANRVAALEALPPGKDRYAALEEIAADFDGLKDMSQFASQAAVLGRDKRVRAALKQERDEEGREQGETGRILELESRLANAEQRGDALSGLLSAWKRLSAMANGADDSEDRRMARRVLRGASMRATGKATDPEYRKIVEQFLSRR